MNLINLNTRSLSFSALAATSLFAVPNVVQAYDMPNFSAFEEACRTTGTMNSNCQNAFADAAEYSDYPREKATACSMPDFWTTYDTSEYKYKLSASNWDVSIGHLISVGACDNASSGAEETAEPVYEAPSAESTAGMTDEEKEKYASMSPEEREKYDAMRAAEDPGTKAEPTNDDFSYTSGSPTIEGPTEAVYYAGDEVI